MTLIETAEYKLVMTIRDHLERDLLTGIAADDLARVTRVTIGKWEGSFERITLSVYADHPLGFGGDRVDASAEASNSRAQRYRPWPMPSESMGGSKYRHIFGTVQVRSLLQGVPPSKAVGVLALVKTRIARCINNDADLIQINDEYGYSIEKVEMTENYGYASGGGQTAVDSHWCDWIALCSYPRTIVL